VINIKAVSVTTYRFFLGKSEFIAYAVSQDGLKILAAFLKLWKRKQEEKQKIQKQKQQ
jgi:hypothetical protein